MLPLLRSDTPSIPGHFFRMAASGLGLFVVEPEWTAWCSPASEALVTWNISRPRSKLMKPLKLVRIGVVLVSCNWAAAQPTVTVQPTNSSVSLGATARFTANFRSSQPPMSQWWFKDAVLDAAINPSAVKNTLLLTNVTLANAGPYFVVASDTTGSVTSTVAVLEVDPTFVKITTDPVVTNRLVYYAYSGAWADYNRDGSLDLLVADGGARLFINNNEGTFREATKNEVGSWAGVYNTCYAANWVDFDNDGWLDLFICAPKSRLLKNRPRSKRQSRKTVLAC